MNQSQPRPWYLSLVLCLAMLVATSAAASDTAKRGFYKGFYVEVGTLSSLDVDTSLDVHVQDDDFGELNLDDILNFGGSERRTRFRGGIRFSRRHELEFSYLSVMRENSQRIEGVFDVLGFEITASADIDTVLETEDVEFGYKFFVLTRPGAEFGFSLGAHGVLTDYSIDIGAVEVAGFQDPLDTSYSKKDTFDVPLPYLGLFLDLRLTDKLYLGALGKVVDVEVDNYDGKWYTFEVTLEHWTFKHLGFGVGYYFNSLDATDSSVPRDIAITGVNLEQSGIQAFVRFNT